MPFRKPATYVLIVGYLFCLLQIWLPHWYLTGDGPCHLYNARILHDMWGGGENKGFYGHFFKLVNQPNPNWMSHLLLAGALVFVKGVVAEKLLLSFYIVLFISGFTRLLGRIGSKDNCFIGTVFLFVFHYVFAKGFYNFSISIALLFWLIDFWLRYLEDRQLKSALLFFPLATLTFFAHPVAFAFGGVVCAALTISYILSEKRVLKSLINPLLVLGLCMLPCTFMLLRFAAGEAHEGGIVLHIARYKLQEFADFNCLVNLSTAEVLPVRMACLSLLLLLIFAIVSRFRSGFRWLRCDGFLFSMLFAVFLYLFFPDKLFGGSLFVVRAQYLWGVFSILTIAYIVPSGLVKQVSGVIFFSIFIWLSIIRISCLASGSDGVSSVISVGSHIKPRSVVLPLNFAPAGLDANGKSIADRNWIFCHAWQYLATEKPLIILDNYEANTGYFPLLWKDEVNPYHFLCTNGAMEATPPHGSIVEYTRKTGIAIDYVLLWCYDKKYLADTSFAALYNEIINNYNLVFTDPSGRVVLYVKR